MKYNRRNIIAIIKESVKPLSIADFCYKIHENRSSNFGSMQLFLQLMVEDGILKNEKGKYMLNEEKIELQKDTTEQREHDINESLKLDIGESFEFITYNIASWKSRFYLLRDKSKKYTIKSQTGNSYKIWRLAK